MVGRFHPAGLVSACLPVLPFLKLRFLRTCEFMVLSRAVLLYLKDSELQQSVREGHYR